MKQAQTKAEIIRTVASVFTVLLSVAILVLTLKQMGLI